MLMESRVKFNSLQNTSGVSQEKDIAVIRNQTLKCTYWTHKRPPYCSSEVIQVSWGLDILSCFEKCYWRLVFSLNVYCSPYVLPLKLVTIHYNCLEDGCILFFLWNSSRVLWTENLHPTFHQHEGEKIMTEFSLWGLTIPLLVVVKSEWH